MTLEATLLIRAASGVVFLGVGIILAWAGRRARDRSASNVALAILCGAFGSMFVSVNLLTVSLATAVPGIALQALLALVALLAAVVFVAHGWLRKHVRWIDLTIAAAALTAAFGFSAPDFAEALFLAQAFHPELYQGATVLMWRVDAFIMLPLTGAFTLITVAAARAHRVAVDPRERKGLILLALGLFAYPAFMAGVTLGLAAENLATSRDALPIVLLVVIAALAWLRSVAPVALGVLGITLLGQLGPVSGIYAVGVGILRIVAAALVALAMLRYGLAGADLHRPTARRGSLATGALASLFIVAQVAQEFFAAEYGLLMGGVVAGTLLFAANPIQRSMERLAEKAVSGAGPSIPSSRENAYRAAVRRYVRDGVLTPDEERQLAHLAGELGLHAGRAIDIRREMETEIGGAGT